MNRFTGHIKSEAEKNAAVSLKNKYSFVQKNAMIMKRKIEQQGENHETKTSYPVYFRRMGI